MWRGEGSISSLRSKERNKERELWLRRGFKKRGVGELEIGEKKVKSAVQPGLCRRGGGERHRRLSWKDNEREGGGVWKSKGVDIDERKGREIHTKKEIGKWKKKMSGEG